MLFTVCVIPVLVLFSSPSTGQLLGHFGFVELPDGFKYRDTETVEASQEAARFWGKFRAEEEFRTEQKRRINSLDSLSRNVPEFKTDIRGVKIGTKKHDSTIFDKFDSNFLKPLTETRSNKPLEEILVEESTSRLRLLPGEGLPPTPAPPARLPNRLQNLNEPIEESERAKNSRLGTIFDKKPSRHSSSDQLSNFKETRPDNSFFDKPNRFSSESHHSSDQLKTPRPSDSFFDAKTSSFSSVSQHPSPHLTGFKETRPAASFFGTLHASG